MHALRTIVATLLISLFIPALMSAQDVQPVSESKKHNWGAFTISYPAQGWKMKVEQESEKSSRVAFVPEGAPSVIVEVFLMTGLPKHDPNYEKYPHMTSVSGVLTHSMELAGDDDKRIFFSTGSMCMPGGLRPSARATVLNKELGRAVQLEACHEIYRDSGNALIAKLVTGSAAGELTDDPKPPMIMQQAYEIIQSIELDVQ